MRKSQGGEGVIEGIIAQINQIADFIELDGAEKSRFFQNVHVIFFVANFLGCVGGEDEFFLYGYLVMAGFVKAEQSRESVSFVEVINIGLNTQFF